MRTNMVGRIDANGQTAPKPAHGLSLAASHPVGVKVSPRPPQFAICEYRPRRVLTLKVDQNYPWAIKIDSRAICGDWRAIPADPDIAETTEERAFDWDGLFGPALWILDEGGAYGTCVQGSGDRALVGP